MSAAIRNSRMLLAWAALLMLALPAPAHHSTANFDMTKTGTFTGTVTYFSFTNPHSFFDMDVTSKAGVVQHYKVFTVARVVMLRNEWKADDLKVGDKVTVTGNPDRKDPTYLYLRIIKFANGKTWDQDRIFGQ